jgi:O-methyltransferase involved in polyketide biosynthesis
MKEKIGLTREQETLLIPLFAKAQDHSILADPKAHQILSEVDYDFQRLKVPQKTAITLQIRAKQLDAYALDFLTRFPQARILHLGCGLDSRCLRVPHAKAQWFDLDLPDVMELRRKFYSENETDHMLASSVTDLQWTEQISKENRPTLIIAEGLLMYLHEADVRALMLCLQANFPGCCMVFDAFSKLTADRIQAHPSLQKTGAVIHWGIDDAHEIERWQNGIQLKEEWFFSQSPDISQLSWFYRSMFKLAGAFQAAQKAQRLLYYQL